MPLQSNGFVSVKWNNFQFAYVQCLQLRYDSFQLLLNSQRQPYAFTLFLVHPRWGSLYVAIRIRFRADVGMRKVREQLWHSCL